MFIFVLLQLIRNEPVTGFVIENGDQLLEIKLDKKFVEIKRAFLIEKLKDEQSVQIKQMTSSTRCIRDKKEYKEYLKERDEEKSEEEEDEKNPVKQFDEIFVELSRVPKKNGKVYGISVECINKGGREFKIYSRSFTYSKADKEWVMADTVQDDNSGAYWKYGGIAVGCLFLIVLGVYFMS